MITAKTGPAFNISTPLEAQLAASVWLLENDGRNSAGGRMPGDEELDRVHVELELVLLEQGVRR